MSDQRFIDPLSNPGLKHALELGQYKQVGGAGLTAAVLIGIAVVVGAADSWSDWHRYQVFRDFLAGDPAVTLDTLRFADSIAVTFAWAYLISVVAAGVVFLVWLWRARQNAELLCLAVHRKSIGWTVWSWVCPIVNVWFPFMIVDDVYRASRPDNPHDLVDLRSVRGSALLGWWWALWLGLLVAGQVAGFSLRGESTVESLRAVAIADTAHTVLSIGAAVLIIRVMRQISGWQTPRWRN